LGKKIEELIPTNIKISSFVGVASNALVALSDDVVAGPKDVRFTFFVIDGKPSYSIILG
ncbi:hypothetical protein MTR_7g073420, partial [Medicago truncatula]